MTKNAQELSLLADVARMSSTLSEFVQAEDLYPNEIDAITALDLKQNMQKIIHNAADTLGWSWLKSFQESSVYAEDPAYSLYFIGGYAILEFQNELAIPKDDAKILSSQLEKYASAETTTLRAQVHEIITFFCLIPNPVSNEQYRTPQRYFFLLCHYWQMYYRLLNQYGTSMVFYRPHPLTRYIVNLQVRIRYCLGQLNDSELTRQLDEAISIPFDEYCEMMYEECVQPVIDEVTIAIERKRIDIKPLQYPLTRAELLFVSYFDLAMDQINGKVAKVRIPDHGSRGSGRMGATVPDSWRPPFRTMAATPGGPWNRSLVKVPPGPSGPGGL